MNEQLEGPAKDSTKDFTGHPGTVTTNNTGGYANVQFNSANHNPISTPEQNLEIVSHELPENATPEIDTQKLEGELKTQKSALEMENKYPSGNDKVRPAILAKIADLEEKLGINKSEDEDKVETSEPEVVAVAEDEKETSAFEDFTKQSREARGLETDNPLLARAYTRLAEHFSGASSALFREKNYAKAAEHKENKRFVRAAAHTLLGAAGIYVAMMVTERYLGFGVSEALGADGPTGGSGATGVTEHRVQMEQAHPSALQGDSQVDASAGSQSDANYNRFEQNSHDRMSTHGAFDGTERTSAQLDDHVLAKIQNNPSLMASVMEVRESGNKDANFSLNDVNHDTGEYTVHGENGEYSGKGQDAVKTLEKSWDNGHQGRLLSDERVAKILETSVFINHGTDEGEFKNALDDKTYSAGVFDYRPELGDQIYGKELGNGEVVYFKVNEKDSSRDCLNVLTLREKDLYIPFTPPTPGNPGDDITTDMDWDHTPREWEPNDDKGPTFGADDKDHQYGNNGEIHENDDPETQQEAGSGNPTKPAPVQTERPAAVPDLEVTAPTPPTPATGPVGPSQ